MYCKKCGEEITTGSGFCPKCGSPVSGVPTEGNSVNAQGNAAKVQNISQKKFNFAAFFFPVIWCFAKQLWKFATIQVVCFGILIISMFGCSSTGQEYVDELGKNLDASIDYGNNAEAYIEQANELADNWNNAGVLDRFGQSMDGQGLDYWQGKIDDLDFQVAQAKAGERMYSQMASASSAKADKYFRIVKILLVLILILHIACGVYFAMNGEKIITNKMAAI